MWAGGPALLVGAFFVPQEIPLEWYPLNEPGNDINYLEIKCASDANGDVQIFYDATHGLSELDSIKFPISPTEQTYTYTFPLLDAPMVGLRLDPVENGGTLTVDKMRIINRREELIRNFTREMLTPLDEIASVEPIRKGWKVTSTASSRDPMVRIDLADVPIVPVGMNHRNLLRCLLSTGYLAGMLTILMLAVVTAFWKPAGWGEFFRKITLVAALSVPLAAIGNRGLIRNSIRYARFEHPAVSGYALEIDLEANRTITGQLFWDVGNGSREADSARRTLYAQSGMKTLRFPLPPRPIRSLRLDPADGACRVRIQDIRVIQDKEAVDSLPLSSFEVGNQIATLSTGEAGLLVETTPEASDPILVFNDDAVAAINRARETRR